MNKEYHKIETLYNRDIDGTKKLIEGSFRNETVEFLKDCEWVWTEKVDGTNIRIFWDGHKVEFGGRTENSQIPSKLLTYLKSVFGTQESEELFEQKFGETEVIIFGEGYGAKIQKVGHLYRDDESFIIFDACVNNVWQKREFVEDIANSFGVYAVPVVGTGNLNEAVAYVKNNPDSVISDKVKMEGVVCRPKVEFLDRLGHRVIVKIKYRDFQ